jgi:hypothetical protein
VSRRIVIQPLSVHLLITRPYRSASHLFVRPHTRWDSIRRCDKQRRIHRRRNDPPGRLQSGSLFYPETARLLNRFPAVHLANDINCHSNELVAYQLTECITFTRYSTGTQFITSTDKYYIDHFAYVTVLEGHKKNELHGIFAP